MRRESDNIPNIVSRVTINNKLYYYLDDGNVYELSKESNKLVRLSADKEDIIKAVKKKFIRESNSMDDVILGEER